MSEMIERIARAICRANDIDDAEPYFSEFHGERVPHWRVYEPDARAAIEAMSEPTNGMAMIGGGVPSLRAIGDSADFIARANAAREVYEAMIGEALMEYPPE